VEREGGLYAEMWAKQAEGIDQGQASGAASYAALKDLAAVSSTTNLEDEAGTGM
jgi:hypothetical protein